MSCEKLAIDPTAVAWNTTLNGSHVPHNTIPSCESCLDPTIFVDQVRHMILLELSIYVWHSTLDQPDLLYSYHDVSIQLMTQQVKFTNESA